MGILGLVSMVETSLTLKIFLQNKDSFVGQVFKYILCGSFAVAIDFVIFYLLGVTVFPCLRATDPIARLLAMLGYSVLEVSAEELERNYWIVKVICFLLVNTVVYTLNRLFVFKPGRHRKSMEILLFFGAALFQFLFIWLGGILILVYKWEVTYSNITMLAASLMVNFLIRKKVVFKG